MSYGKFLNKITTKLKGITKFIDPRVFHGVAPQIIILLNRENKKKPLHIIFMVRTNRIIQEKQNLSMVSKVHGRNPLIKFVEHVTALPYSNKIII